MTEFYFHYFCHSFPSKEQVYFNFMVSIFSPSVYHEVMGPDAVILPSVL